MEKSKGLDQINNICIIFLAAVALFISLKFLKPVFVPFLFSLFLFSLISPFLSWMQLKLGLPRAVALLATYLGIVLFTVLLYMFISYSIQDFLQEADMYREKLLLFSTHFFNELAAKGININPDEVLGSYKKLPVLKWAQFITGGLFSFLGQATLVFVFVVFMVLGKKTKTEHSFIKEVESRISRYTATKFLTSSITAIIVGAILVSFGVDLAFMFAILTFLLNFIPSVGSVFAVLITLPVLWLQFGFGVSFFVIFLLTGAVQLSIGNFIEPKLMGESMDLHPVTILVFLIFWGIIWGVPGLFLAVPITAVLRWVLAQMEPTQSIAEFMAGR